MRVTKSNRPILLLFVLPALIFYLWWVIYPIFDAIAMSFQKTETLHTSHFAGLENYRSVFTATLFWKSFRISLIFIVCTTALQVVLPALFGAISTAPVWAS